MGAALMCILKERVRQLMCPFVNGSTLSSTHWSAPSVWNSSASGCSTPGTAMTLWHTLLPNRSCARRTQIDRFKPQRGRWLAAASSHGVTAEQLPCHPNSQFPTHKFYFFERSNQSKRARGYSNSLQIFSYQQTDFSPTCHRFSLARSVFCRQLASSQTI